MALLVKSLGNDETREPYDRFGSSVSSNSNDASIFRLEVAEFSFRWRGPVSAEQPGSPPRTEDERVTVEALSWGQCAHFLSVPKTPNQAARRT